MSDELPAGDLSDWPLVPTPCHGCGYVYDRSSAVAGDARAPGEGDVSVCLGCGAIAIYLSTMVGLTTRPATDDERDHLIATDARLRRVLAVRARLPRW